MIAACGGAEVEDSRQVSPEFKNSVPKLKHMFDSRNKRLIAETIFLNPGEEFHVRGLAEETGVSPSTVSRVVKDLEERGIVETERDVKMSIRASETSLFRDYKLAFNLWRLAETGLIERLEEEAVPEAIVLFGSYSRGEDSSGSDIDIAVVNGRDLDIETSRYEGELGREISLHSVDLDDVKKNFLETLSNGIVLRGYLEV